MDVREKLVELLAEFVEVDAWDNGEFIEKDIDFGKIVEKLIDYGVTVQEWISVDERLPNLFENVLVFRDGKISIDYNEENGWFVYDLNGKRATYWMPLPEKPKGE